MKILFCPCYYMFDEAEGGSDPLLAYAVGDGLASRFDNSIVVTGVAKLQTSKKYKIIEIDKKRTDGDFGTFTAIAFTLKSFWAGYKILRREKFDIVHQVLPFHPMRSFNLNTLLFRNFDTPMVIGPIVKPIVYDNSKNVRVYRNKAIASKFIDREKIANLFVRFADPILKFLSSRTLRRANLVIASTQDVVESLVLQGVYKSKIWVQHLGVHVDRFEFVPFRQKYDGQTIRLLAVGYLIERKGFDDLIRVLSEVKKTFASFELTIIGSGPMLEKLQKLVWDLNLSDNVKFAGFVPNSEVSRYYKNAHVFVNMSREEGYGINGLEALASGLPIVSTRVGGFGDFVSDGKNGHLVEVGDSDGFVARMLSLLRNTHLIDAMGSVSRSLAESEFDWDVILNRYEQKFGELIGE